MKRTLERILYLAFLLLLSVAGCDEVNMMKPVVSEPEETPPAQEEEEPETPVITMDDMKQDAVEMVAEADEEQEPQNTEAAEETKIPEPPEQTGFEDFIGQVRVPTPTTSLSTREESGPLSGVTVTIIDGKQSGKSATTDQNGQYAFPNIEGDELCLLIEKDGFEPKEVIVHRSKSTKLKDGTDIAYRQDPQKEPGVILMGQSWPEEVRFILRKNLLVPDLLFVTDPPLFEYGGFYSQGLVVVGGKSKTPRGGLLLITAHEIAHAHQHAIALQHAIPPDGTSSASRLILR